MPNDSVVAEADADSFSAQRSALVRRMAQRFVLASSVTLSPRADGTFEVSNGADLRFPVSAVQGQIISAFRRPTAIEDLVPDEPTRAALRGMAADLVKKLVLVEEGQSSDAEMRQVWNYLSLGPVERAVFHIDNESKSLDEFEQSGVEAVRALEAVVPLTTSLQVATIGCGMGRIEKALAPKVAHVTAFDISDEMLARARGFLEGRGNVTLTLSDGSLRPLADASIDLVATFLVFQHVAREGTWRYLAEAGRVVKPGGRLFFQIHCYPEGAQTPQVANAVERYYGAGKETYREADVRAHLAKAGFEVELFRDGALEGDERRLTGTPGPWRSVLVLARK